MPNRRGGLRPPRTPPPRLGEGLPPLPDALPDLLKVNINTASFKELLRTPYLDYKLTKKICAFRDDNEFFQNLNDLKKIDSFPVEKFDRIALYLCAE